jgi:O-antigen/teichoic acid export membrane protein
VRLPGLEPAAAQGKVIDTGTKRRLILGLLSNWVGKIAGTLVQLVQVPVFLHFWDVNLYGEWVIVSAIPAYLSFSNIGFGSVANNEMTMLTAAGDQQKALGVFQSCWWLIVCISAVVALLLWPVLLFVPVSRILRLHAIGADDTRWILLYLGLSVLLGQFEQLMSSAYTSVGRYAYGALLKSVMSLLAFGAMLIPVVLGHGARTTALVFAIANGIGTITLGILVRRDIPWIRYGWQHARLSELRRMVGPALAFMGFPIGVSLNLQGTLIAVGYALGPLDVVIFSTARTVSRVALQMVQMVNFSFWPELSLAYGAKDEALFRALHRRSCQLALAIGVVVICCMMSFGPWFLHHWTGGHVPPSRPLLAILLLVVVFYALWSTSSTVVSATNQHQKLAAYFLAATSITIVFTFLLAHRFGLYGAAASLLIAELIMNVHVLPNSLRITHDTFRAFLASLFDVPVHLRPLALLRSLSRAKPGLES